MRIAIVASIAFGLTMLLQSACSLPIIGEAGAQNCPRGKPITCRKINSRGDVRCTCG